MDLADDLAAGWKGLSSERVYSFECVSTDVAPLLWRVSKPSG